MFGIWGYIVKVFILLFVFVKLFRLVCLWEGVVWLLKKSLLFRKFLLLDIVFVFFIVMLFNFECDFVLWNLLNLMLMIFCVLSFKEFILVLIFKFCFFW